MAYAIPTSVIYQIYTWHILFLILSHGFEQLHATPMTGLWLVLVTPLHAVSLEWCGPCQRQQQFCRQLSGWLTIGHICINILVPQIDELTGWDIFLKFGIHKYQSSLISWFSVHGLGCCVQYNNVPNHAVQDLQVPNIVRYHVYICSYAIPKNVINQWYACHMPFLIIYHIGRSQPRNSDRDLAGSQLPQKLRTYNII